MSNKYFEYETHVMEALHDLDNGAFPCIAAAARHYDLNERSLQKRAKGGKSKSERVRTNTRLTAAQEKALCTYIDYMDSINIRIDVLHIREAAEQILYLEHEPSTPFTPLGPSWVKRFLSRHPEYRRVRIQSLAGGRTDTCDLEISRKHFEDQSIASESSIATVNLIQESFSS